MLFKARAGQLVIANTEGVHALAMRRYDILLSQLSQEIWNWEAYACSMKAHVTSVSFTG